MMKPTCLRICRETGCSSDLVERLLRLGRIDEAVGETERISDSFLTHLADLFLQHGHETVAERLIRARLLKEKPDLRIAIHQLKNCSVAGPGRWKVWLCCKKSETRFFAKALGAFPAVAPRVITVDKNAAYPKAFQELQAEGSLPQVCELRQSKYLNNLVEQDHRFIKPGMGFFSFQTAWRNGYLDNFERSLRVTSFCTGIDSS